MLIMGIIYICESRNTPGILKVGKADDEKLLHGRFTAHSRNGYRGQQFEPFFAVETPKYKEFEQVMKVIFSKHRIMDSELYVIDKENLKQLFELLATKIIYPKPLVSPSTTTQTRQIAPRVKRSDLGIKYGDILPFAYNEKSGVNFFAENIDDDVVRFEGNDYAISNLARKLYRECNPETNAQNFNGNDYFTFKGKTLSTIAKEKGLR